MKTAFGKKEGISILISTFTAQLLLNMPRVVSEKAGTAGWILVTYVSIMAFLLFLVLICLYKKLEGKDLIDLAQDAFGGPGRIIAGLVYFSLWSFVVVVIIRQFAENIKIISLVTSPISFVLVFFLAGIITAAYAGIEPLARVSALTVPFIIGAIVFILIASIPNCEYLNIFPILGNGPREIFLKGIPLISIYLGIPLLFSLSPYLQSFKTVKSVGVTAILLSAAFFLGATVVYQMVYPFPVSTENFLPIYQLAKAITLGRFFERIEAVFLPIWGMTAFIHMSFLTIVSLQIMQKTLKLNSYKPLIPAYAVLIFSLCLLPPNLMTAIELEQGIVRTYGLPIAGGLALLILIAANIKKARNRNEKSN